MVQLSSCVHLINNFVTLSRNYSSGWKSRYPTCITAVTCHMQMVWAVSRSLAATREITDLFSFRPVTKMFQFTGFPSIPYGFRYGFQCITTGRFLNSEIRGSRRLIGSPRLIADWYVLLRLLMPRHPPFALSSFT